MLAQPNFHYPVEHPAKRSLAPRSFLTFMLANLNRLTNYQPIRVIARSPQPLQRLLPARSLSSSLNIAALTFFLPIAALRSVSDNGITGRANQFTTGKLTTKGACS
jgi:hypothetical protein